jgi:hypothetical protein
LWYIIGEALMRDSVEVVVEVMAEGVADMEGEVEGAVVDTVVAGAPMGANGVAKAAAGGAAEVEADTMEVIMVAEEVADITDGCLSGIGSIRKTTNTTKMW